MRHSAILLALACAAWMGCSKSPLDRPGVAPKHVLLITASSLRADHLSCYLYPRPTSSWPADEQEREVGRALALDDAAAQGVMFANAFSPANRTIPALQALFSGSAAAMEVEDRDLSPDVLTLAESFQAAGFQTAAFVSGAALRDKRGLDQGFELWQYRFGDTPTLALATEWLAARDLRNARPLFLWIHLSGADPPHDPRAMPPRHGDEPGVFDFGRYFEDPAYGGPADGSLKVLDAAERGELALSEADRAHLVDLYDGEVARVASGVRSLLLFLRNQGDDGALWRDTVFVFAGLHGVELGEHGSSWSHARSLSECVLRVPLFVRHPGSLTGARILAEVVGLEDLALTLCEWLRTGAPSAPPGIATGRTLLALTDSFVKRSFPPRPAIALTSGPQRAASLRTREWSVLWSAAPEGSTAQDSFRLYDRARDPLEQEDLSARHADVGAALSQELERAFAAAGWKR